MHLRSLLGQKESIGWYPLTGKTSQSEAGPKFSRIRGSVKLRIQWIYTPSALLEYYILLSQVRASAALSPSEYFFVALILSCLSPTRLHSLVLSCLSSLCTILS